MIKALIVDNGGYTWLAELLGRLGVETGYYSPWENAFPLTRMVSLGSGLAGVERVNEPLRYLREDRPDLVIVPDLNHHDLEALAREWGLPTFGSGEAARLEQDRLFLKEFLAKADLPVGEYEVIDGIDDLEEYLRNPKNRDKYLKVSTFRGDLNTFHHEDWEQTSDWLIRTRAQLGPLGNQLRFLLEEPLETELELSLEGIFIDGQLLEPFMVGMEIKDAGEAGWLCPSLNALPPAVADVIRVIGAYFEEHEYRNFFAVEIRLMKDGTPFVTDVACRMPVPPGAALCHMIDNLIEVLAQGAEGFVTVPEVGKLPVWFTEIEVKSRWRINNFLHVRYPAKVAEQVALFDHCLIDDERWCLPHMPLDPEMDAFGSVFSFGASLKAAAADCQETCEQIKALEISWRHDVLDEATEKLEKLADHGFEVEL